MNDYYEMWKELRKYVHYVNDVKFGLADAEVGWALDCVLDKMDELEGVGKYDDWYY